MRIGPNKQTVVELKDQFLEANRVYRDGREKLVKHSVNTVESKTALPFTSLFFGLTILIWLVSVLSPVGFESLYNAYGFYPIAVVFVISYFGFYLVSKIFVKPSADELSDDTSYFSLFSACSRKEMRSWFSLGPAVLNTLVWLFYLVNKDTNWIDMFK